GAGHLERAELLRLRAAMTARPGGAPAAVAADSSDRSARLRALMRTADLGFRARVHANTTAVLHLAASTSSPWSSGVARFVDPDPQFDDFRRETFAGFEAMAIAIEATHFIAGEDLFDWRLFDADRFRAGPASGLRPRHVAWRRDAFELAELGAWGMVTPAMVEHGLAFDRVQLW
ncbi:MAG TPA: hypothetical protein VN253_16230, partial [Kofleriaceae bacterium]|nr:hypothetical protein [Kofleriaceae bacterium]